MSLKKWLLQKLWGWEDFESHVVEQSKQCPNCNKTNHVKLQRRGGADKHSGIIVEKFHCPNCDKAIEGIFHSDDMLSYFYVDGKRKEFNGTMGSMFR